MKILQIAPIYIPLRPDLKYGGIERVVLALAKSFNEQGHSVLNAAPADSAPYGDLLPTLSQSEWEKPKSKQDPNAYEKHVNKILDFLESKESKDISIIHDHTGNFVLSSAYLKRAKKIKSLFEKPIIVTPHELKRFRKTPVPLQKNIFFTALSNYQRKVFSRYVEVKKVIHNGVFVEDYPFQEKKEEYVFSLGSIERDKGQDLAARASLKAEVLLIIGGNIEEQNFYELEVRSSGDNVRYVGELNDKQKKDFYKRALAFLAPIRIGDCFSLTRIESLACGTPVITLNTGSAREAITHEKTGYLIDYGSDEERVVDGISKAIQNINKIDPMTCRREAEERFSWKKISREYIDFYKTLLSN